jgi:hypothetical protein
MSGAPVLRWQGGGIPPDAANFTSPRARPGNRIWKRNGCRIAPLPPLLRWGGEKRSDTLQMRWPCRKLGEGARFRCRNVSIPFDGCYFVSGQPLSAAVGNALSPGTVAIIL